MALIGLKVSVGQQHGGKTGRDQQSDVKAGKPVHNHQHSDLAGFNRCGQRQGDESPRQSDAGQNRRDRMTAIDGNHQHNDYRRCRQNYQRHKRDQVGEAHGFSPFGQID